MEGILYRSAISELIKRQVFYLAAHSPVNNCCHRQHDAQLSTRLIIVGVPDGFWMYFGACLRISASG